MYERGVRKVRMWNEECASAVRRMYQSRRTNVEPRMYECTKVEVLFDENMNVDHREESRAVIFHDFGNVRHRDLH